MTRPVCAVVGVGPGNGAAFARRFAADGHAVALLARSLASSRELAAALPGARAWECDVGDAGSVQRAFDAIRGELGDPEVVIYNAGSGLFGSFDDVTAADFEASWRVNAARIGRSLSTQLTGTSSGTRSRARRRIASASTCASSSSCATVGRARCMPSPGPETTR